MQKWVLGSAFFIFYFAQLSTELFLLGVFFLTVYKLSVSKETWKQVAFGKSVTGLGLKDTQD